ncbi:isoprenylcysteine carboxylmethyltransferase family protein [Psychromonas sp. psych-6C06]|uniref:methyltransferase family protein n=1 Tax=Psychromonas sp. psych-6C06 TaxID=2058089 RepID=UPI00187C21EF|nr:isoprenylcysteine carboxylmethyltransferase family protein [Psychromonas sp. psych-6C06]
MIYVTVQFMLLMFIGFPVGNIHFSLLGLLLVLVAAIIAILALSANRLGNFNIRPVPKTEGKLITSGIYMYIRHPMYSSLFFAGLGIVLFQLSIYKLIAWCFLVIILIFKARVEENMLIKKYDGYQRYQEQTKRFIPYIY